MKFSYYKLMIVMMLMFGELFLIVSMALNKKIDIALNIFAIFFSIRELCKKEVKEGAE